MVMSMSRSDVVRDYGGVSAETRRADRRTKLLAAGRQVWGESGVAEVSVRGVCAASGLTPRYFYEHFPNREALIGEVALGVRAQVTDLMVATSLATPGGLELKLRAALTAFFELLTEDRHVHRMVSDVATAGSLVQYRTETHDLITELVLHYGPDLIDADLSDAAEVRRSALFVVGGVNMVLEAWLREPTQSAAELAAACTRLCLAAIGAGGSSEH